MQYTEIAIQVAVELIDETNSQDKLKIKILHHRVLLLKSNTQLDKSVFNLDYCEIEKHLQQCEADIREFVNALNDPEDAMYIKDNITEFMIELDCFKYRLSVIANKEDKTLREKIKIGKNNVSPDSYLYKVINNALSHSSIMKNRYHVFSEITNPMADPKEVIKADAYFHFSK